MIMIAVLHEVLLTVIPPMLLPLIRPIKIDSPDIPILAEHLSVIHFSQKFYGMPLLQLCFKHSECSKSFNKCYHFKHAKRWLQDKNYNLVPYARKWFPILCNNSSDTICYKNNNVGFPKWFPMFWAKKENYYSPVTIHPSLFTGTIQCYCSLRNFAYLRGVVPYIQGKCFYYLVQDFFLRERLPLRAFLCENILAYTSYFLLTLPTFSTKLVTPKAL